MAEKPPKSYAQLVKEVLERFSGDELPEGSLREHWRIASSSTQPLTLSEHSKATLHRLNNLSSSSSSSSSSGVAVRTKESLIKLNATGNSSIAGKDRHFLACIFSSSSSPSPEDEPACYVYTSKESTLSDLLEWIANKLPQFAFQTALRPEGQCLALYTSDCKDWHLWDRRSKVSEVLRDFEAIHLLALPTEEAVQNQTILDALIKQVNEEEKRQKEEEEAARSESLKEETAAPPLWFRKGDTLEYADGQQCVVVEVHMDDFPHVYYTVRMLSDGGGKEEGVKEKQTVHEKLRLLRAWEPLPEDQGGMHLRVDWAGVNFSVHGVDPAMSVAELKVYIERCCPQPSSLRINQHTKLVCKGSTLPDKKLLSSTKIKGGSKLMLIG